MNKIFVLTEAYPDLYGNRKMNYVHTRNKKYLKKNIEVTVLSFSANTDYLIDDISVICLATFKKILDKQPEKYKDTVLVCHAPNIRHHFKFLIRYKIIFSKVFLLFHGHEILPIHKYYPESYKFMKQDTIIKKIVRRSYDFFKILVWKYYFLLNKDIQAIFVSNWLAEQVFQNIKKKHLKYTVINNCVGEYFEKNSYSRKKNNKYNFITLRNNLDQSTYCIDLICEIAKKNPQKKFLLIGKGNIFNYIQKPKNVDWINKELSHDELAEYIDQSEYGLMPTRQDTQGVMSCELATYGIPLITSNLPICKEIFKTFRNVIYADNTISSYNKIINGEPKSYIKNITEKNDIYFSENTVTKELQLFFEEV